MEDASPEVDRVVGPGSKAQSAKACRCHERELVAARLACIEEEPPYSATRPEGKYRATFDDTAPRVNNKIRVQDQMEMPGAPELQTIVSWSRRRSRRGRTRAPLPCLPEIRREGCPPPGEAPA